LRGAAQAFAKPGLRKNLPSYEPSVSIAAIIADRNGGAAFARFVKLHRSI
jgi:hypothetical protein